MLDELKAPNGIYSQNDPSYIRLKCLDLTLRKDNPVLINIRQYYN